MYNAHLALFVRMDDTITQTTHQYVSSFSKLELALEVRALYHQRLQTRQQAESLQTGKECVNMRSSTLEEVRH